MLTIQLANDEFLTHVSQLVGEGKKVSIRLKGNSMCPFLHSGRDVATLQRAEEFRVGDVVLAELAKGKFVLHRIDALWLDGARVKRLDAAAEGRVVLRGDGNVGVTESCLVADLRAKATEFVRDGRRFSVEGTIWRLYSCLWVALLPLRRYLLSSYRLLAFGQLPGFFRRR